MQARPRRRLLVVGEAAGTTGFGRVVRGVAVALATRGYDVHVLGLDLDADAVVPECTTHVVDRGDVHGGWSLPRVAAWVRPDVVLAVNDYWMLQFVVAAVRALGPATPVVCYTPVDGRRMCAAELAGLARADVVVAYTDWARQEIRRADPRPWTRNVDVVPHMIDGAVFTPALDRRAARRLVFGRGDLDDAFIVLNANRNSPRKRIDLTIAAFAAFARDKQDDVLLHLHTSHREPWCDVPSLARRFGVADRLVTTPTSHDGHPCVGDPMLASVYGGADVGVSTAASEGWGLTAFEHAATGAAQVLGYPGAAELWGSAAVLVTPRPSSDSGVPGASDDAEVIMATAGALDDLFRDGVRRARMGAAAYVRARSPELAPAAVADRWSDILERAVAG